MAAPRRETIISAAPLLVSDLSAKRGKDADVIFEPVSFLVGPGESVAPAPFTAIGFPDQEARATHYSVEIPWAMGLIGTRSLTQEIPGINELVAECEVTIRDGLIAYDGLMTIREERDATPQAARHV